MGPASNFLGASGSRSSVIPASRNATMAKPSQAGTQPSVRDKDSERAHFFHITIQFCATVQRSLFFARQMQRERRAALTCAVRMLAWMADGFAMLRIASAMTGHARAATG